MVFVGSRKNLAQISFDFKDIWITFIHAFNRLKNEQSEIKAMFGQIQILLNLISKKNETLPEGNAKEALTALWTILNKIKTQLREMITVSPEMQKQEFSYHQRQLLKEIQQAKKNIALCSEMLEEYEKTKEMTPQQLSRRQFFQRAGNITKGALAAMLVGSTGLTTGIYTALMKLSKDLPLKKEGLAILISYGTVHWWDMAFKPFGTLFVPAYIARVELAFGQKANIVKKAATSKDLFDVLKDKSIRNIVIFGHGSWSSWHATDVSVASFELHDDYAKENKKRGVLVRHTCGVKGLPTKLLKRSENEFRALALECQRIAQWKFRMTGWPGRLSLEFEDEMLLLCFYLCDKCELKERFISTIEMLENVREEFFFDLEQGLSNDEIRKLVEKKMNLFFDHLKTYIQKNKILRTKEYPLFGTPYYSEEQIKGWDRITYPWEYMIDVFGDRKLDQLYAKK